MPLQPFRHLRGADPNNMGIGLVRNLEAIKQARANTETEQRRASLMDLNMDAQQRNIAEFDANAPVRKAARQGAIDQAELASVAAGIKMVYPLVQQNNIPAALQMLGQRRNNLAAQGLDTTHTDEMIGNLQTGSREEAIQAFDWFLNLYEGQAQAAPDIKQKKWVDDNNVEWEQDYDPLTQQTYGDARIIGRPEATEPTDVDTITRTYLGDDNKSYQQLINKRTGESVGQPWLHATQPQTTAKGGLSVKDKASFQAKALDAQEALTILDDAEKMLNDRTTGASRFLPNTGPIDQFMPGKWNQEFESKAKQLFAVAKRVYKAPGEGQFSDADARALEGMLFHPGRYADVNMGLISDLRKMLTERARQYSDLAGDQKDDVPPPPEGFTRID